MILKILQVLNEEWSPLRPRFLFSQFLVSLLPFGAFNRLRTVIYRMSGIRIGKRTVIMGRLTISGNLPLSSGLTIGSGCRINSPLFIDLTAPVTIGNNVALGHHVVLITTDHETGDSTNRAGANKCAPIVIDDGAWVGASTTVLPGVTIGSGSVVAAGSLVSISVLPNRVVGGVPARVVKTFAETSSAT